MTCKEIKKEISIALRGIYPNEKVYGTETVKGYRRPCLFVSVSPGLTDQTVNVKQKTCYVEIMRVQPEPDEDDALEFFGKVENAFSPVLRVGDRALRTSDFQADFVGDEENVPQIEFEINYLDKVEKTETSQTLEDVRIKEEL